MASRGRIRIAGLPTPPVAEGRQAVRLRISPPANDNPTPAGLVLRRVLVFGLLILLASAGYVALG
ncbi:MAG: hypothetical protein KIT20_16900 [Alphaproteobacteria bacterium]|nr:hypothetical protein [Alphaproteobacteria bacterium]